ncbi:hypothetical protein [Methylobacterium sp. Leaf113]|uniref:hypothetical protein n=1 Tax=Methylobacterium sp. Leaf113 TaxID=1736259 RepID=UPI000ADF273C|nr:hypothetical protein [Methylobacterium sp. Leaf113]
MNSPNWCHLAIEKIVTGGRIEIIHRATITDSKDPLSSKVQCAQVILESRYLERTVKTVSSSASNSAVCEQRWASAQPVSRSWFIARIRQSDDAEEEIYPFVAPLGSDNFTVSVELDLLASKSRALMYIGSHPDLIEAFGASPEAARNHYKDNGRFEKRVISFDAMRYVASHADLHSLWPNLSGACEHFINHGYSEGRALYFDPYVYLASNKDLIGQLQPTPYSITDHYIVHGSAEGRRCRSLLWEDYIHLYPDALKDLPHTEAEVARHFVLHGYSEGRQLAYRED